MTALRRRVLAVLFALVAPLPGLAAPGDVSIVSGTEDPVQLAQGDRRHQWFRLMPGEDRLELLAEGPVVLLLRLRVLRPTTTKGVLRIYRGDDAFSDNPFELSRDLSVVVETSAAAEKNAASDARKFHLRVPAGTHRFQLAPLNGGPVAMRVTKAKTFDPALQVAPERVVAVVTTEPVIAEPAPEPRMGPTPPMQVEEPDLRAQTPTLEVATVYEEVAENDPSLLPPELAFRQRPKKPYVRKTGPAIGLRGGVWGFAGTARTSGGFVQEHDLQPTGALELAWDLSPVWSVTLDGSVVLTTRGGAEEHSVIAVPVGFGFARFFPMGEVLGLRLKVLGSGAWIAVAPDTTLSSLAWGGLGALALEVKAGPGRVSLEARAQMLFGALASAEPSIGALHSGSVLLGYRLEL